MNKEAKTINVPQRPLHGTKLFVKIASIRSLGDSIIRVEITAAALQPNPMAIVKDCFPCAPTCLNSRSILKATRGDTHNFLKEQMLGKRWPSEAA